MSLSLRTALLFWFIAQHRILAAPDYGETGASTYQEMTEEGDLPTSFSGEDSYGAQKQLANEYNDAPMQGNGIQSNGDPNYPDDESGDSHEHNTRSSNGVPSHDDYPEDQNRGSQDLQDEGYHDDYPLRSKDQYSSEADSYDSQTPENNLASQPGDAPGEIDDEGYDEDHQPLGHNQYSPHGQAGYDSAPSVDSHFDSASPNQPYQPDAPQGQHNTLPPVVGVTSQYGTVSQYSHPIEYLHLQLTIR